MRYSLKTSVESLLKINAKTSFTQKELNELGVEIPDIKLPPKKIRKIRVETHCSQSVFAKILNVSPSSVRQWEQGRRRPTGSTKVLLELLEKNPHLLDYRVKSGSSLEQQRKTA